MKRNYKQYALVGLGSVLCSIAINVFFVPHHLLSGGISGIALMLYYLFKIPVGLQIFLMNIPLFYAAYRYLGKEYTIIAMYGTMVFSAGVDATQFLSQYNLVDDPILAAITGGVLSGIGSGCIFKLNGSAGGLDIVVGIIKKYYSLNVGAVSFALNFGIMLVAAALFGVKLAILTLLAMYIGANITDKVVEGLNRKKTIYIISYCSERIAEAILQEVGRGATLISGQGAFTHQEKKIIFVVVTLTQIAKIKFLIEEIDPDAFMIVQDAAEVMGRGFTLPGTSQACKIKK